MAVLSVYLVGFVQVASDIVCAFASAKLAKGNNNQKLFFWLHCVAFSILALADIYYNYVFRILKSDIVLSGRLLNMMPLITFQLLQSFNWYYLLRKQSIKIISWFNLPYIFFGTLATFVLLYFFYSTNDFSMRSPTQDIFDILSAAFDMFVWFFTIICLGRTKSSTLAMLALGVLMIVSADLTMTCLYMFEKNDVVLVEWPHIIWASGAFLTAMGFVNANGQEKFTFFSSDSIHANCSWWLLISSLIAFVIGFVFPFFFADANGVNEIHYALWDMPISLMFTMVAATLLSNRFSKVMLSPINSFSQSIESFKADEKSTTIVKSDIKEFKILGDFIDKSFKHIAEQLDNKIKISAQVAHDIRSPLSALEIGIKLLPSTLDESKRILLRDAVRHIKDITNNLEKDDTASKSCEVVNPTQIAVLLDNVISERRLALSSRDVKVNQYYDPDSYGYFSVVVPSLMKRILTNILNNSYEAIANNGGIIDVNLNDANGYCVINITDNGGGISNADIPSLFKRGFSTKRHGSGLGLHHAKETLAAWGASIELFSIQNSGTKVIIKIPLVSPPLWFVSKLSLIENETVVCVDDSLSVYQGWQARLKSFGYNQKLIYCQTMECFLNELKHLKYKSATYLIDVEFSGKAYQGYDFANLLLTIDNSKNRIFMVTSRSSENEIQSYCVDNSIRIIPKDFAVKIPLSVYDINKQFAVLTSVGNKEVALLDSSKWHIYSNANDLIADIPYFSSDIKIFIHKDADNGHINFELKKLNLKRELFENTFDLNGLSG